jgi:Protein of unknown function (DUF3349)
VAVPAHEDPVTAGEDRSESLIARVVRWLRAGYPDGVPQQDYVALLGILRRALTPAELDRVVSVLYDEAAAGDQILTRQLVEQRIADIVKGPIDHEDVVRVSVRLVAAGWPLGSPLDAGEEGPDDTPAGVVTRVVDWLRAGYPTGLPAQDFIPLVALLRRRLSDDEVREVGRLLSAQGGITDDRIDIGSAIAEVTSELPSDDDIERVRAHLALHGWPSDLAE